MKTRYLVECLQSGQPRPYADSYYEYLLTAEMDTGRGNGFVPRKIGHKDVERLTKLLCGNYYKTEEMPHPFATRLISLEEESTGVWRLKLQVTYND